MQSVSSVLDWAALRDCCVEPEWFALIDRVKLGFSFVRRLQPEAGKFLRHKKNSTAKKSGYLIYWGGVYPEIFPTRNVSVAPTLRYSEE